MASVACPGHLQLLSSCYKVDKIQHFIIDKSAFAMEWKGHLKDGNGNNGTIKVIGELLTG